MPSCLTSCLCGSGLCRRMRGDRTDWLARGKKHRRSLSGTHHCLAGSGPPNTFAHDASSRGPVVHAGYMRGERGLGDFAREAQAYFHKRIPNTFVMGGGVWVNRSLGPRGSGCQSLDKDRIAAHSAGPTTALQAAVPPIRSLTMLLPAGLSYMPATCGGRGA